MRIIYESNDRTINFAAEELSRCLHKMTDDDEILPMDIRLEICADPRLNNNIKEIASGESDSIYISVINRSGFIAGSNSRSILIAVYKYLNLLGCRWSGPGVDGEFIPKINNLPDVYITETASYKHRGVCIEGYTGIDHMLAMIDWMPKLGFNTYFIQFRDGFDFFNRFYLHEDNSYMEPIQITCEDSDRYISSAINEINKRGMILHMAGHGWTGDAIGIKCISETEKMYETPTECVDLIAMVNAKRELYNNDPIYTNLCYSNPTARDKITDEILAYAEKHKEINVIHFWLADGMNNSCECDECRKARPSDFFIKMLNELDVKLSAKNIDTKIVFLAYNDLFWPPIFEHIANAERFIMMFAPSNRTYSEILQPVDGIPNLPDFKLNKLIFPSDARSCVSFLKNWQSEFSGDSFDFDYHLMFDPVNDPGHMSISEIIHEDIKGLKRIGLNGYISCQLHRIAFPTGFAMDILGKTLWNVNIDFDTEAEDYFTGAFGEDGILCLEYLSAISRLFDPAYMRGEKPAISRSAADSLQEAIRLIDDFHPVVKRNLPTDNPCHRQSWFYLEFHAEITRKLAEAMIYRANGERDPALNTWIECKEMIRKSEPILHPVLDVQFFTMFTENILSRPIS